MKQIYSLIIALTALLSPLSIYAYSLEPASGATVNSIEDIRITYDYTINKINSNKVFIINNATQARINCRGYETDVYYYEYMKSGFLKFPKITEAGSYTLVIEQGAIECWFSSDPTNQEISAVYTIDSGVAATTVFTSYSLSPDPSKVQMSLSSLRLRFPKIGNYDSVTANPEVWKNASLTCGNEVYHCVSFSGSTSDWYLGFNKDASSSEAETITKSGAYLLTIPAGSLTTESGNNTILSQEITATYNVDETLEFGYSVSPVNGSVNSLPNSGDISIVFTLGEPASEIKSDPAIIGADWIVKLNDKILKPVGSLGDEEGYSISYYGVTVNIRIPRALILESSTISISAAKGAFTVNDLPSPSINYSATYNPPKDFKYFFTPADTQPVKPFKSIKVTFTNVSSIEKQYYCRDTDAKLTPETGNAINSSSVSISKEETYPTLIISFTDEIADGSYTFTFPKGNLLLDKEESPLLSTTFIVDSNAIVSSGITPPYSETFDSAASLDTFVIVNANEDKKADNDSEQTWEWKESELNGAYAQEVAVSGDSKDDWLISPAIKLEGGRIYKVSLHARALGYWTESFEILAGDRPTQEAMISNLITITALKGEANSDNYFGYFTPSASGDYHIGIHANTTSGGWTLIVDNLEVSGALSEDAPAAVDDLTLSTSPDNNREAVISMKAPNKTINDDDLTYLSKIEVSRNGQILKTFENPIPGEELKYMELVEEAGDYSFTVTPFSSSEGIASNVKHFIGTRKALSPANVKVIETENKGSVTVSWEDPETDINGDPINPENISYYIEKIIHSNGQSTPSLLKRFVKGNNYTAMIVNPEADQEFYSFAVYAETDGGISEKSESGLIPLGKPYPLPYSDSFSKEDSYLMSSYAVKGDTLWELYSDEDNNVESNHSEGGYSGMINGNHDDSALLFTGKIDLTSASKPVLTYYVYKFEDSNGAAYNNELDIMINPGDGFRSIDRYVISNEFQGLPGWFVKIQTLYDFAGKEVQLGFMGIIKDFPNICIDNIMITDEGATVGYTESDNGTIHSSAGYIHISNPACLEYSVYSINGITLNQGNDEATSIPLSSGIYLVKLGQKTSKITVK